MKFVPLAAKEPQRENTHSATCEDSESETRQMPFQDETGLCTIHSRISALQRDAGPSDSEGDSFDDGLLASLVGVQQSAEEQNLTQGKIARDNPGVCDPNTNISCYPGSATPVLS